MPSFPRLAVPPVALVLFSIVSTQLGSAIAKPLFPVLGPAGVVLLRLAFSALMLACWQRPDWRRYGAAEYRLLVLFGLAIALMNGFFYAAIARIPIGIAVTLEFLGPLGVALFKSRRRLDLLWVALAAVGIALLSPWSAIGLGATDEFLLDPLGVVYALLAAVGWGSYILLSAKAGESFAGEVLPLVLGVATVAMLPSGIASAGWALFQPKMLLFGAIVAFLASVMTYSLEMLALKRLPIHVFGVLMSLEPAIASCLGFVILGETLSVRALMAIALVSVAAGGAAVNQFPDA